MASGDRKPAEFIFGSSPGAGLSDAASDLLIEFLGQQRYERIFCLRLIEFARTESGAPWEMRRLAAAMLENQLVRLPLDDLEEHDLLLARLGLKHPGLECPIDADLLSEGYTGTGLRDFVPQLHRRLGRFARIHRRLDEAPASEAAVGDFLYWAARECKLTLARHLLTADEAAARILQQVRLSRGFEDRTPTDHICHEEEARLTRNGLSAYEARLLQRLTADSRICWDSGEAGSQLNSLVERPLGAIVLVVKPPGSTTELEIKRTGHPGPRPLNAAYKKDGFIISFAHRLDGGSFGHLLRFEAGASSFLSLIYRLAHGRQAPMGRFVSLSKIHTIPSRRGNRLLVEYFTDQDVFGEGFDQMRSSLEDAVEGFIREKGWDGPDMDTDMGRTAQFLSYTAPGQAVLAGTTSFRLDRLAAYLSADGPRIYFRDGLGIDPDPDLSRRWADEVLEEVLGVLDPPEIPYCNHREYVEAALGVPSNRERADAAYRAAFEEMGRIWGTLLAVRGYSGGESFVARNVGLRSCWQEGRWKVRIIFMDHDNLNLAGKVRRNFEPSSALHGMFLDWKAVLGGSLQGGWLPEERPALQHLKGEAGYLNEIYRPDPELQEQGIRIFDATLLEAYDRTKAALKASAKLRELFCESFVERLDDWDETAREYLQYRPKPGGLETWQQRTRDRLASKGYSQELIEQYLKAPTRNLPFLERFSFLWEEGVSRQDQKSGK